MPASARPVFALVSTTPRDGPHSGGQGSRCSRASSNSSPPSPWQIANPGSQIKSPPIRNRQSAIPVPELAEVEFFRKRWDQAAIGERVVSVLTHDQKKL